MATITQQCPHCGNIVEGKKVKTYTNKVTRQGAKTAVHMATSAGGMATGAAVGSAILPGIGTVVGGALGFIGSAMFNQKVNENIDKAGDAIEDNFMNMDYEFTCPKCGYTWTNNDTPYDEETDKDEEEDNNEDYNPERDRFYSFLNSYVNDEYKDMDVVKRAEMFKREGDACDENWYKACYYYLASFSRLEHFLIEWLDYGFRNDSKNIDKLNTICLIDGYEEIKSCFELVSVDKEFILVYETYDVVRAFWLDNQWNPKLYDFFEEKHRGKELESENCFINPDYLEKLYFASLEGIRDCIKKYGSDDSEDELSAEEQEYLNEYKEMLADGEISDRDRRYLNKIMNANGISEVRAKELEAMASSPSLTDEEQEYLNEYRDMISDGEISPRDQRFLDKLKKTNGISEARAKELEAMA